MARTPHRKAAPDAPAPNKSRVRTALQLMLYAGVLGLLALVVAVGVAMASLPGYGELTKRSDLGQMIRVRGNDGTVLVSLGPSFGQWLRYSEIPPEMRAAMI